MAGCKKAFTFFYIVCFLLQVTFQTLEKDFAHNATSEVKVHMDDNASFVPRGAERVLSRKRRYLAFPEGSSLQLVFCLTLPLVGMKTIFTIGATAALAWELPHDPMFFREHFLDKKFHKKPAEAPPPPPPTQPPPHPEEHNFIEYEGPHPPQMPDHFESYPHGPDEKSSMVGYNTILDEGSNQQNFNELSWQDYNSNQASRKNDYYNFNKFSIPGYYSQNYYPNKLTKIQPSFQSRNIYQEQDQEPITSYVHPIYHEVYRRTRRDLYKKIEGLFTALSRDGKACLLKAICEVSQASARKGTFLEEILKAIFRIKPDNNLKDEDHYDRAFNKSHNCTEIYPSCHHSIFANS